MTISCRIHLFPFRTQKLSCTEPKILAWRRAGKIGRCRSPFYRSTLCSGYLYYFELKGNVLCTLPFPRLVPPGSAPSVRSEPLRANVLEAPWLARRTCRLARKLVDNSKFSLTLEGLCVPLPRPPRRKAWLRQRSGCFALSAPTALRRFTAHVAGFAS